MGTPPIEMILLLRFEPETCTFQLSGVVVRRSLSIESSTPLFWTWPRFVDTVEPAYAAYGIGAPMIASWLCLLKYVASMLTRLNSRASKPYSVSVVTSGLRFGLPRYARTMYGVLTPLTGPIDALKYGIAAVAPGCTP